MTSKRKEKMKSLEIVKIPELSTFNEKEMLLCISFRESQTFGNQIKALRQFFEYMNQESYKKGNLEELVIQWYLDLSSKSPLRKAIISCLNKIENQSLFLPTLEIALIKRTNQETWPEIVLKSVNNVGFVEEVVVNLPRKNSIEPLLQALHSKYISSSLRALLAIINSKYKKQKEDFAHWDKFSWILSKSDLADDDKNNYASLYISQKYRKHGMDFIDKILKELTIKKIYYIHGILHSGCPLSPSLLTSCLNNYLCLSPNELLESCISRGIYNLTSLLLSPEVFIESYQIQRLLNYSLLFYSKVSESMKHSLTNIISNVFLLSKKNKEERLVIETLGALHWTHKVKYVALNVLLTHCSKKDFEFLFKESPDILIVLVKSLEEPSLSSHSINCLKSLISRDFISFGSLLEVLLSSCVTFPSFLFTSLFKNVPLEKYFILNYENENSEKIITFRLQIIKSCSSLKESHQEFLTMALRHFNDEIRLLAFDALTHSDKTSEPLTSFELDSFLTSILRSFLSLTQRAHTQSFISIFQKVIYRLSESTAFLKRDNCSENANCLIQYQNFVMRVREILFSFLRAPLRKESQRNTTYLLLKILIESLKESLNVSKADLLILLNVLNEEKKEKNLNNCFNVLFLLQEKALSIDLTWSPENKIIEYAHSCKSFEIHRARLLTQLFSQRLDSHFHQRIENILEDAIQKATHNVSEASTTGSLIGFLSIKGSLLTSESLESSSRTTLNLCLRIWNIVSGILCSEAPEGFTLESLQPSPTNHLSLFAWRSTKELCVLLNKVATKDYDSEKSLQIAEFFISALTCLKHRGAFELCHEYLVSLSKGLMSSKNLVRTQSLYHKCLKDLESQHDYYRRSGGLPFIFQAYLLSVVEFKELNYVMDSLLKNLCSEKLSLRIHVFNILRVLFRDGSLGEKLSSYLAPTLIQVLQSVKSLHWPERNSAMLCASAVLSRIFGVKKNFKGSFLSSSSSSCVQSSSSSSFQKTLSSTFFFTKYASLHSVLLQELKDSLFQDPKSTSSSVFLVLYILTQLYVSPGNSLLESVFLKSVSEYLKSPLIHIRKWAAQASLLSLSEENIIDFIENLSLSGQTNTIHGSLLQMTSILQSWTTNSRDLRHQIKSQIQRKLNDSSLLVSKCLFIKLECLKLRTCHQLYDSHFEDFLMTELSGLSIAQRSQPGFILYFRQLNDALLIHSSDKKIQRILDKKNSLEISFSGSIPKSVYSYQDLLHQMNSPHEVKEALASLYNRNSLSHVEFKAIYKKCLELINHSNNSEIVLYSMKILNKFYSYIMMDQEESLEWMQSLDSQCYRCQEIEIREAICISLLSLSKEKNLSEDCWLYYWTLGARLSNDENNDIKKLVQEALRSFKSSSPFSLTFDISEFLLISKQGLLIILKAHFPSCLPPKNDKYKIMKLDSSLHFDPMDLNSGSEHSQEEILSHLLSFTSKESLEKIACGRSDVDISFLI